jgi:hypothetical protein
MQALILITTVIAATTTMPTSVAAAAAATPKNTADRYLSPDMINQIRQLNDTFYTLFTLCTRDSICNDRFYIDYTPSILRESNIRRVVRDEQTTTTTTTPTSVGAAMSSESDRFARFKHLMLVFGSQPQSALGHDSDLSIGDFRVDDARWWLRLLRTARFCTDNEVWESTRGCVCPPDKLCHAPDSSQHHWEVTRLQITAIAVTMVNGMLAVGLLVFVKRVVRDLRRQFLELARRLVADPQPQVESIVRAMHRFGDTSKMTVRMIFNGAAGATHDDGGGGSGATVEGTEGSDVVDDEGDHYQHHMRQHQMLQMVEE